MPDLDLAPLRGRTLFVGTPMYDGKCYSDFAFSIARLTALCTRLEINLQFHIAYNEAIITKARNVIVDEFLRSGNDHLIFIDADIGFDARDVVHLLGLQVADEGAAAFDVVAAPYPLKRLSWERVLAAARAGKGDADPDLLARYASPVAISPVQPGSFALDRPVEVTQAGTGFMMIRRETFERYRASFPQRRYRPDRADAAAADIHAFFDTEVDSKHGNIAAEVRGFLSRSPKANANDVLAFLDDDAAIGTYSADFVSEDYAFCRRVREAGMKVWLCPWMELTHTGNHRFTSRLVDLHAIGAL